CKRGDLLEEAGTRKARSVLPVFKIYQVFAIGISGIHVIIGQCINYIIVNEGRYYAYFCSIWPDDISVRNLSLFHIENQNPKISRQVGHVALEKDMIDI